MLANRGIILVRVPTNGIRVCNEKGDTRIGLPVSQNGCAHREMAARRIHLWRRNRCKSRRGRDRIGFLVKMGTGDSISSYVRANRRVTAGRRWLLGRINATRVLHLFAKGPKPLMRASTRILLPNRVILPPETVYLDAIASICPFNWTAAS